MFLALFANTCVQQRVSKPPIFENAASQAPLEFIAGLLEHTRRSRIPFKDRCLEPLHGKNLKCVLSGLLERCGRNPASPERLTEPIADLGGFAIDVIEQTAANTANSFALEFDGKVSREPMVRLT